MAKKLTVILFFFIYILAACAPVGPGGTGPVGTPRPTDIVSPPGPITTDTPTVTPPEATPTRIAVDLTPAQRAALQVLSEKHNIPVDQIHLLKTEAMTWPNGCLGIVLPGVMCTQGLVDGFKITLEANGRQYEVHTNQDGTSAIDAAQQLSAIRLVVLTSDGHVTDTKN